MRPATGTHVLRKLREMLDQEQKEFASTIFVSKSMLHKLENQKKPLSKRLAEQIAACTGIDSHWLLNNDPNQEPRTPRGKPYNKDCFILTGARRFYLTPTIKPFLFVRSMLLQQYAKTRDLFSQPEMHREFYLYLAELDSLTNRFTSKSRGYENKTVDDLLFEERKRNDPEVLYPSVIKDAEKCQEAQKQQRERFEREQAKTKREQARREASNPFLPKVDLSKPVEKRVLKSATVTNK